MSEGHGGPFARRSVLGFSLFQSRAAGEKVEKPHELSRRIISLIQGAKDFLAVKYRGDIQRKVIPLPELFLLFLSWSRRNRSRSH